jgi:hypothetical protein
MRIDPLCFSDVRYLRLIVCNLFVLLQTRPMLFLVQFEILHQVFVLEVKHVLLVALLNPHFVQVKGVIQILVG